MHLGTYIYIYTHIIYIYTKNEHSRILLYPIAFISFVSVILIHSHISLLPYIISRGIVGMVLHQSDSNPLWFWVSLHLLLYANGRFGQQVLWSTNILVWREPARWSQIHTQQIHAQQTHPLYIYIPPKPSHSCFLLLVNYQFDPESHLKMFSGFTHLPTTRVYVHLRIFSP